MTVERDLSFAGNRDEALAVLEDPTAWPLLAPLRFRIRPDFPQRGTCGGGRRLGPVLPKRIENWPLTSLQQRLAKTGGRLVKPARYYWLMLAESHPARRLFASMVRRIGGLAVATG